MNEPTPIPTPLLTLPAGDIHFDGHHLYAGGQELSPGQYTVPGTDGVLHVFDDEDDELH